MFVTKDFGDVELLTCEPLARAGVRHGFTSRRMGFGKRDAGERDRAVLSRVLGVSRLAFMKQVHGDSVEAVVSHREVPECDGLTTDEPGLGLIVHSADCVPLLFWARDKNAVAAVHAGWRGTLLGVARAAVDALASNADELHVAMGPAIRACCFEVGDEVVEAFVEAGRDADQISRRGPRGRRHVDLIEDHRRQLVDCGVSESRIYDSGRCTACETDRFYSYRREGNGVGRLMGVIAVK